LACGTNMTGNLTSPINLQRFTELFELASQEEDQDKVGALFEEILCLLENETTQHTFAVPLPMANRTPQ
jgi:hypothetical protein